MATKASEKEYDYVFKVVLVGDTGVGKSSLLLRFADDLFTDNYITTIGVDFRFKTIVFNDKIVKIQIWDTAGQERYKSITNAYYRGADAIIIVFDMTNRVIMSNLKDSFFHCDDWLEESTRYTGSDICKLILGNKYDLLSEKKINNDEVHDYEKTKGIKILQTSAKLSYQVESAFKYLIETLIKKEDERRIKEGDKPGVKISGDGEKMNKEKNCCN